MPWPKQKQECNPRRQKPATLQQTRIHNENYYSQTSYDKRGQTFNLAFGYRPLGKIISAPIVLRTRAAGGWSGKSLYITTSGFKVK